MSLLNKFLLTLRGLYDFRVLLLLGLCAGAGFFVDPEATLGLAGYLAYVIGMWGAALALTKILMPYVRVSECSRLALHGNMAAALTLLARTLLLVSIAVTIMAWGK